MTSEALLLIKQGRDKGGSIALGDGVTTIGRSPFSDIVVDLRGVSRQHAAIKKDRAGFWVTDLGSVNGTYVNDRKLGAEPHALRNLDRIEVGGTEPATKWVFMESSATAEISMSNFAPSPPFGDGPASGVPFEED